MGAFAVDEEQKHKDPIKVEELTPFAEKAVAIIREKENDFPDGKHTRTHRVHTHTHTLTLTHTHPHAHTRQV